MLVTEILPSQICAFIDILSLHLRSSSHSIQTPFIPQKAFPLTLMSLKKQTITHNDALSKGMTNTTIGGTIPHTLSMFLISEGSRQRLCTAAVQRPDLSDAHRYEGVTSPVTDRKNATHEHEALKHLNDQLQALIATLQST